MPVPILVAATAVTASLIVGSAVSGGSNTSISSPSAATRGTSVGSGAVRSGAVGGRSAVTRATTAAPQAPCTVDVTPASDFLSAVNRGADKSVVCFAPGVYRVTSPLVPRAGQTLRGAPGATLSGALTVSGWTQRGSLYVAHGYLPAPYSDGGVCEDQTVNCSQAETLRVYGTQLRRATSLAGVSRSAYYADYANNDIYLGYAPSNGGAELSRTRVGITGSSPDVTIEGFRIEGFASLYQRAAVMVGGPRWTLRANNVRWNHNLGIQLTHSDDTQLIENCVHDNGETGIGSYASARSRVTGNTISNNNTDGYWISDGQSGGIKYAGSSGVFDWNTVVGNRGVGVWADSYVDGLSIHNNRITDNWADGVRFEISRNATIANNVVTGNALRGGRTSGTSLFNGGGIDISNGSDVSITGNTLAGNLNGIALQDRSRRPGPDGTDYHTVRVSVTGNSVDIHQGTASTGVVQSSGNTALVSTGQLVFDRNTYIVDDLRSRRFQLAGAPLTFAEWQQTQDRSGTVRTA